jgi:conjugative transfer region protein TrbK
MDTKLFARVGGVAFVAIALTMTALTLREGPEAARPETITVWEPDGDPLPAQLKACNEMGELALSSPDCRAAWTEKRRRFLGVSGENVVADNAPAIEPGDDIAPPGSSPKAKEQ